MPTYLQSLRLQNLLSFGPDSEAISFGPLNVLIGPNGSGKSNLLEAIGLLAAAPRSLSDAIREGGGIGEWLWKGSPVRVLRVEAALVALNHLKYTLTLEPNLQQVKVADERIEDLEPDPVPETESMFKPILYFGHIDGRPHIRLQDSLREVGSKDFKTSESILSQREDPEIYPELFGLRVLLSNTQVYRNWSFGRHTPSRLPQPADLPNDFLMGDTKNLGLILNKIRRSPKAKDLLIKHMRLIYEDVRDVDVMIEGGTVQVFIDEGRWVVPAARLSDGTLRWLCLLAILLNPDPRFIIGIEEPELGLHPDLLPPLAELLKEASQQMQLVVTTHSDTLISAFSDTPEAVLVCEKHEGNTTMRRFSKDELSDWLKDYSLGQLWRRGELGGNRW